MGGRKQNLRLQGVLLGEQARHHHPKPVASPQVCQRGTRGLTTFFLPPWLLPVIGQYGNTNGIFDVAEPNTAFKSAMRGTSTNRGEEGCAANQPALHQSYAGVLTDKFYESTVPQTKETDGRKSATLPRPLSYPCEKFAPRINRSAPRSGYS